MSFGAFFALSFSLCLRFVSRIAFGALIGYYVDKFFGSFPCGLIVFIILGSYLGLVTLVNIYKKGPNA